MPARQSFARSSIAPVAICIALCVASLSAATEAFARAGLSPTAIAVSALPREARTTLDRIRSGGPFHYDRDGVIFSNRERILPAQPRGYYHEYTVPTPGTTTRGARRIVCGGNPATLTECYYSDDHYKTFRRIRP